MSPVTNEKQNTNMNWKGFIAHMIRTIIWPAVVLIFIFGFRGVIKEKIAQADHLSIAGVLELAFPIAEKIMADKETLAKIDSDGINSEEDLQTIDKIISTSSLYASLLSDAGFKGKIVEMSNDNYDTTQKILKKVVEVKKLQAKTNLSATDINNLIDSRDVLASFGMEIEQFNEPETLDKIRMTMLSLDIEDPKREQLSDLLIEQVAANIQKTLESIQRNSIELRQISSLKIDPKVLRNINANKIRKSIRPRNK